MTAVFDFDKTLTYHDTLVGFYKVVNKPGFKYYLKRTLLIIAAICYKLKIIDNNKLKKIGVRLFLKGKDKSYIDEKAIAYAGTIKLNEIYYNDYQKYSIKDRIIVSASLMEYLKPLFPKDKILSSSLLYSQSQKVIGLNDNFYAEQKLLALSKNGIERIDTLYTDSYSDRSLMQISDNVFLINKGVKILIKEAGIKID